MRFNFTIDVKKIDIIRLVKNKYFYQIMFSCILIFLLVSYINPESFLIQLMDAPIKKIIPWRIACELLLIIFWSVGIYVLFSEPGDISYEDILTIRFKQQCLSMIIPGRIGDISFIYFLKNKVNMEESSAILFVDKLITLSTVSLIAIIGFGHVFDISIFLLLTIVTILLVLLRRLHKAICFTFLIEKYNFFKKYNDLFCKLSEHMVTIFRDYKGMFINLVFTVFKVVLAGVSFSLILYWFGEEIPSLWYVIMVQSIVQVSTIVPLTYMGIGLVEGINVSLLSRVGVDPAVVLAAVISVRLVQVCLYFFVSLIWARTIIIDNVIKK